MGISIRGLNTNNMAKKLKKLEWHTEQRKVKDLLPFKNNPRLLSEKQRNDLIRSLKRF